MKTSSRFRNLRVCSSALALAVGVAPPSAHAQAMDDEVADISAEAMFQDYAAERHSTARKKLERAIKKCGRKRCSDETLAELQRDLGVVLLAQGRERQARAAFEKALTLDPSGKLDPELATPAVSEAFRAAGGEVDEPEPEPEPEPRAEPEPEANQADEAPPEAESDGRTRHWLSVSVQQDWFYHSDMRPACGGASYDCFASGSEYAGAIWPNYGNRVAAGLAPATTRLLVGFERLFGKNLTLGLRVGLALRGGPEAKRGGKFLPVHAELRAAWYFGADPFAGTSFRPYVALGGGLADVRSRLAVDFWQDAAAYNEARQTSVDAWRAAGKTFVAPTLGAQLPFGGSTVLSLEARLLTLLGKSGVAPAASLGLAQGF
jgi:Tetratricopeptide repeat